MVLSFLGGIGYTSTLSTFHQYVINPREEDLNGTDLQGVVSVLDLVHPYFLKSAGIDDFVFIITLLINKVAPICNG